MSKIVNEARIKNKLIVRIRELLEHRAFWLYLLVDEAEKRGLDPEEFASAAITRCGISQGTDLQKKSGTKSLKGLRKTLFPRGQMGVRDGSRREYGRHALSRFPLLPAGQGLAEGRLQRRGDRQTVRHRHVRRPRHRQLL